MVTIFQNLYDKNPFYLDVDKALARIKNGKSGVKVQEIRNALDKAKINLLKKDLPAVVFSGKLAGRGDKNLQEHSGFIVLDFDKLEDLTGKIDDLKARNYIYAIWVSPTGTGIKALAKIASGAKHREHFEALKQDMPDIDPSGVNEERLCFESYDPELWINHDAKPFTGLVTYKEITEKVESSIDDEAKFKSLLKWIANKSGAFSTGNRNRFIFILAGACCRFGLDLQVAAGLINAEFTTSNDFTHTELLQAVKSAYRSNKNKAGTVIFEKERIIEISSRKEFQFKEIPEIDPDAPPRDVVYAADVKQNALNIYDNGYGFIKGVEVFDLDSKWKPKRGEVSGLTGIGNMGKSSFYKWYQLMRVLLYGERFASFTPEDNPPEEYYHDFVEILLACDCTPSNPNRPTREVYEQAYDWIGKHIFYLYPNNDDPTPEYIMERFLELIVKEKIDGCCIDPFNGMANDYGARSDKYLESTLNKFTRFAQLNNVYFVIIIHPVKMKKNETGNYECPDKFDLADGAMWNNKMDNILVYHRPFATTDPNNVEAEFHSKKVRRQKVVGRPGMTLFRYIRTTRRFEFGTDDPMERAMKYRGLQFGKPFTPTEIPQFKQSPIEIPEDFWNE